MLDVGTHLEALGELISKKGKDITAYQQKKRTHTYDVCILLPFLIVIQIDEHHAAVTCIFD